MRRPFIFTSLGVVRGESKRGNRKCGPENKIDNLVGADLVGADFARGRVGQWPSLLGAEFVRGRDVPESC